MGINYMPEVAKILGLKIEEEFDLIYETGQKADWGPYKITCDGLEDEIGNRTLHTKAFLNLLAGKYTLQKRPWRPKDGDMYWIIDPGGYTNWYNFNKDDPGDLAILNMGNCFPTEEAAEAARPEMLAKFEEIKKGVRT